QTNEFFRQDLVYQGDCTVRRIFLSVSLAILVALAPGHAGQPAGKAKQKLYITNSSGNDITVVDVTTNKVIGRIEVGPHPHGIAVPASQDLILVTLEESKPGELVWIDTATDRV